jgi:chemotaxis receptor (MCP) glutamine deamidase CheD
MSYSTQSVSELLNWKKMTAAKYGKLESKIMNGSGKDAMLLASICVCKKNICFVQECIKRAKEGVTAQNFLSTSKSRFV